jgi:hypothetical protein
MVCRTVAIRINPMHPVTKHAPVSAAYDRIDSVVIALNMVSFDLHPFPVLEHKSGSYRGT